MAGSPFRYAGSRLRAWMRIGDPYQGVLQNATLSEGTEVGLWRVHRRLPNRIVEGRERSRQGRRARHANTLNGLTKYQGHHQTNGRGKPRSKQKKTRGLTILICMWASIEGNGNGKPYGRSEQRTSMKP